VAPFDQEGMNMTGKLQAASIAAGLALSAPALVAAAGLEGADVTVTAYCCTAPIPRDAFTVPATAIVGSGMEFPAGSLVTTTRDLITSNVDVSAFTIEIAYTQSATAALAIFNGFGFDFTGAGLTAIIGVALNPASTFAAGSVGLTFDGDSVFYNASGLSFTPSSRVIIDVTLAPVPEPASGGMLAAGLLLMMGLIRRQAGRSD